MMTYKEFLRIRRSDLIATCERELTLDLVKQTVKAIYREVWACRLQPDWQPVRFLFWCTMHHVDANMTPERRAETNAQATAALA